MHDRSTRRARTFALELHSTAAPERLFDLLADAPGWPHWFPPARRVEWVATAGSDPPGGAGSVRRVWIGPVGVEEEIVEETRPTHHAYSIRTAIPVRNHRADVRLTPTIGGTGTEIRWASSFSARWPGTGWLLRGGLSFGVHRLARSLITAAEREFAPNLNQTRG